MNRRLSGVDIDFLNPYCFTPISEEVFRPEWRNNISHDIPFTDGVSGFLDITFEALTPIIVKEGKNNSSSVNINGSYFIPGTTIKGMIRNVLEILSLSKMGSVVKDNKYSVRDLTPANIDYTLKTRTDKIKAGLLVMINDKYYLIESQKFEKLTYSDIEEIVEFPEVKRGRLKEAKSVKEKYDLLNDKTFYYEENSKEGFDSYILFCSGKMQNKEHEYGIKIPRNFEPILIENKIMDNFLFIHEKETKSKSWEFWKTKIKNFKEIPTYDILNIELCFSPVFYTKDDNERIESLGLAFLHREPYKYSVHQFINDKHKSDELDLSQCIFGSSKHNQKGRVQFSHAFVDLNNKRVNPIPIDVVLGSPKPTFYPFYLKQKDGTVSTFSDSEGELNGWKRYLVHETIVNQELQNQNINVRTKLKPLPQSVFFTSRIRFHNLKQEELGALISAITFHNNSDKCFHLIGMAKPLGYGKLKLADFKMTIKGSDKPVEYYMAQFEKEICNSVFNGNFNEWKNEILPLFMIATGNYDKPIHYPSNFSSFKAIKIEKLSLVDFSPSLSDFELKSLNQ